LLVFFLFSYIENADQPQENAELAAYVNMVENDNRCDMECHQSCQSCVAKLLGIITKTFCNIGGAQCANRDSGVQYCLLPCW